MTCWRCSQSTESSSAQILLGWYGFRCHQVLGLVMSYAGSAPHAWGTLTALHLLLWGFWKSWWVSVLPLLPSLWLTSYLPVYPGRGTYSVQASRSCAALIMLGKRGAWVRKIREVIPATHSTSECALLTPKSSSPTQCLQETPACFCILPSFLFLLLRWPRKHL